jgi:putative ABC transport system permease protein
VIYVVLTIVGVIVVAVAALAPLFLLLYLGEHALNAAPFGRLARFLLVALKSLRRNLLRTTLTYMATFVLVVVIVMVWSVLYFLGELTTEKAKDLKIIVSEKYQMGSQMPFFYAGPLSEGAARSEHPEDTRPQDSMTWQFYVGTLDPTKATREDQVFFIALEPCKMLTVMDDLIDDLNPGDAHSGHSKRLDQVEQLQAVIKEMERNKRAVILGRKQLETLKQKVGGRFKLSSINYQGIDLEFEIIAVFPDGRYNESAVMNRDYLNDAIDAYPKTHGGAKHPLANKSLNLVWLKVGDLKDFGNIAEQIERSGRFVDPAVKCQTLSSGISAFIEGFKDLFKAMRWLLAPAILCTMVLVIANAISISVRERRTEIAVLKVLGYRPVQIMLLILSEAMLIGTISGALSTTLTYLAVNYAPHSRTFNLWVPNDAFWWGPVVGALAALAGSALPAWSACKVRVSEVFARTA